MLDFNVVWKILFYKLRGNTAEKDLLFSYRFQVKIRGVEFSFWKSRHGFNIIIIFFDFKIRQSCSYRALRRTLGNIIPLRLCEKSVSSMLYIVQTEAIKI